MLPSVLVEVVRSPRRRKTIDLRRAKEGSLRVSMPVRMSAVEEREHIANLLARWQRKTNRPGFDLEARARSVAAAHHLGSPTSVRWVDNQNSRWASCTPSTGEIRISSRLADFPLWVLDYVIVHELAHLWVPGHPKAFWDLVDRYPKAERARGFLIAKGYEESDD